MSGGKDGGEERNLGDEGQNGKKRNRCPRFCGIN